MQLFNILSIEFHLFHLTANTSLSQVIGLNNSYDFHLGYFMMCLIEALIFHGSDRFFCHGETAYEMITITDWSWSVIFVQNCGMNNWLQSPPT